MTTMQEILDVLGVLPAGSTREEASAALVDAGYDEDAVRQATEDFAANIQLLFEQFATALQEGMARVIEVWESQYQAIVRRVESVIGEVPEGEGITG